MTTFFLLNFFPIHLTGMFWDCGGAWRDPNSSSNLQLQCLHRMKRFTVKSLLGCLDWKDRRELVKTDGEDSKCSEMTAGATGSGTWKISVCGTQRITSSAARPCG